jgi:predicted SnoaL-like aldol condensation-catalyzing enzyme
MKVKLFIAVAIMLSMMLIGCGNQQDKIVINFFKSLEAGKLDEALSYLSKPTRKRVEDAGGKPALAASADVFKKHKGIKQIKITRRDVTGETATIVYCYIFNDGSKVDDYLPLVKENGEWKISNEMAAPEKP